MKSAISPKMFFFFSLRNFSTRAIAITLELWKNKVEGGGGVEESQMKWVIDLSTKPFSWKIRRGRYSRNLSNPIHTGYMYYSSQRLGVADLVFYEEKSNSRNLNLSRVGLNAPHQIQPVHMYIEGDYLYVYI